ncbi:MAG: long-chain fatty acid--CoA ligase [Desulfobacteraceae bacterium]|nr:long-chain-fatty-acid--CoA ligase [Desulfobacteraceae bacterium]MBC2758034.1 long-chain fatty acid--CoA ligase [Desulfobacteraceae bacterium]
MGSKPIIGFPATSQDNYQLNVTSILRHAAKSFGRQEVVSIRPDGTKLRFTYKEIYSRVKRLGNALTTIGAEVGDRIGVLDWNSHRHLEAYYGIPGIGSVLLLLNIRLTPQDLGYVVNHAEAKYIMVDETLIPIAEAIAGQCETVKGYIILTDKDLSEINTTLSPIYSYEKLLETADENIKWPIMDEKSAYGACYTTGTTGRPKGVYYSHRDVYLHAMTIGTNAEMTSSDCFYQLVPMFHALGWGMPQATFLIGAKYVLPGMYNIADLGSLAEPLVSEGVTVTAGAPALFMPMLEYIRKLDKKPDLTGARFLSGASEPSLSLMKDYYNLTGAEIVHAYGATETTPLVTINKLKPWLEKELSDDEKWDLKRKQGYPVVGLDVKIVDHEDKELPLDGKSPGEILIRGPWVTATYYNSPGSETQFTEDGYWRSGDAGTMDKEGYIKITDRVKDLIKSGGEWISSVDMENETMAHPGVLEAAVTGVAHPKWEERPVVLVVPREVDKGKLTIEDIINHLAKKFAKWQLPDTVVFVDAIPKTSVGKFDKKVIREQYRDIYQ